MESQGQYTRTSSFMLGTQGTLLIGAYQSPLVFLINLMIIIVMIILSFTLSSLFGLKRINDCIFLLFCFPVMSGMANEYMGILLNIFIYVSLFLFINLFKKTLCER
jgi:hypothetical protein